MRILVTDGKERASLAVVRSLGRAGYEVGVVSSNKRSLAGGSRHARTERRVPDPLDRPDAFVDALREVVTDGQVDLLVPMSEASLHAVLSRRDEFEGVEIPFPEHRIFDAVCDKARVREVAMEVGIPVPGQVLLSTPESNRGVADRIEFPVVVKPSRSVIRDDGEAWKTGVRYAGDRRELIAALEQIPQRGYPVLVQEHISGTGTGIFLLLWEGRLLAAFAHRRLREKPPSGGVSVLRESIPLDPEMLGKSRQLLERFDWRGVAMVEYKRDRETGSPFLMEVNGRFWGSLQLAIDAGVDFPRLLVEAASGGGPEPVRDYREGIRSRWFWGDVDHLLARMRRSRGELNLDSDAPGRGRVLRDFLSTMGPGVRHEVLRWNDPRPVFRETADWVRGR